MISRTITFEPTSVQRGSGVAFSRLRISFSRCWTSGMAAKMPSCIRAMARMLGTKNDTLLRRPVWSDSVADGQQRRRARELEVRGHHEARRDLLDGLRRARSTWIGDHGDGDRRRGRPGLPGRDRVGEALRNHDDPVDVATGHLGLHRVERPVRQLDRGVVHERHAERRRGRRAVLVDPAEA